MIGFDDFEPDPAKLVPLPEPREPTAEERAVLQVLASSHQLAALERQAATARVVSRCGCGCGSVGLHSDAPPVPASELLAISDTGRTDVVTLGTIRMDEDGLDEEVLLHLVDGRLDELEVWAKALEER